MKVRNITSYINSLLGLALALTPFVLFPVCSSLKPDGSHMGCFYSALFITLMGAVVCLLSLVALKKLTSLCLLLSGACALLSWLVPNRIITLGLCGLCSDPSHPCRASTMPAVGVLVVCVLVVCVLGLIINFIGGSNGR